MILYHNNFYFNKYGYKHYLGEVPVDPKLEIVITIPVFNEPNILTTLNSLDQCDSVDGNIEVILMINGSEKDSEEIKLRNENTLREIETWIEKDQKSKLQFLTISDLELPKKHAGVGLARKIAMDEASLRFHQIEKDGIIVCFDADSQCDPSYLREIQKHFQSNPKTPGCSIYFEHPIEGDEFEKKIYGGIINYELHLRYYNQAFRFTGHPAAYHTIGSSMACRSSAYEKQGGMNRKKAGEDFYFLHKIIELGNFTELNSTRVIPSPRPSDRVPFGTGKAISKWLDQDSDEFESYAFESFKDLKYFFQKVDQFYTDLNSHSEIPLSLKGFLKDAEFSAKIKEFKTNSTDLISFTKRFFQWFNAFKVLKFVHYSRDEFYPNQSISACVIDLCNELELEVNSSATQQLLVLRQFESFHSNPQF